MGRKGGSYKFEKRQKELKKQKKRREKLERRQKETDDDSEPTPSVFDVPFDSPSNEYRFVPRFHRLRCDHLIGRKERNAAE